MYVKRDLNHEGEWFLLPVWEIVWGSSEIINSQVEG